MRARRDSNSRPQPCEECALSSELRAQGHLSVYWKGRTSFQAMAWRTGQRIAARRSPHVSRRFTRLCRQSALSPCRFPRVCVVPGPFPPAECHSCRPALKPVAGLPLATKTLRWPSARNAAVRSRKRPATEFFPAPREVSSAGHPPDIRPPSGAPPAWAGRVRIAFEHPLCRRELAAGIERKSRVSCAFDAF